MAPVSATNGQIRVVVASNGLEYRLNLFILSNALILDALSHCVRVVVSLSVLHSLLFHITIATCPSAGVLHFALL